MAVEDLKFIGSLLPSKHFFTYYPALSYVLGTNDALLVSNLLYWQSLGAKNDWTYKKSKDMQIETGLSENQQVAVINRCIQRGFLVVVNKGIPQTRHYNIDIKKLANHINKSPKTTELVLLLSKKPNIKNQRTITKRSKDPIKEIDSIYATYLNAFNLTPNDCRLTPKRRLLINERLEQLGYKRVCAAIENCAASSLYNGEKDGVNKGTIEFIFKDYETTENMANMGQEEY